MFLILSLYLQVKPCTTTLFQVIEANKTYMVNIHERTCSCKRFDIDEVPCCHALAVIAKRHLKCYDYCSKYYKTETMRATYQQTVHPLPNESEWHLPENLDILVLPPKSRKPPGRPRKKRVKSHGEPPVKLNCNRCGKPGHNRRTCRNPPMERASTSKEMP